MDEEIKTPQDVIDSTKYRAKIRSDKALAKELGILRQTFSHKRKYPGTFTSYEVRDMAKILRWEDGEIATFIRGIK